MEGAMKKILTLALTLCFAPPAMAGSIKYLKCGLFNIRIDRAADNMFGVSFDTTKGTTKGKEDRRRQYKFLREKAYTEGASEFASWSGVSAKDRRVIMKGVLETNLANGRTTYTEESFIGQKSSGKVVKTCTAGKSNHF
jgi:hypothetical protein